MIRKGFSHEDRGNTNIEWYTPKWVFDRLDMIFDLDPCHPEDRIPWVPALDTFSLKDDGLSRSWSGKVWLNPPYGKHTGIWLKRLCEHGDGVCLVFSRTDCKWFHDYISKADAILFLSGRVKFVDGFGISKGGGAGSGSLLAAWGKENVSALKNMVDLGFLISRV